MDVSIAYSSTSLLQSSSHFLKELTEEASTTLAGNLFHVLIKFWLKKHLLTCNLHLFTFNFQLWPLSACPHPLSNSKNAPKLTVSKPLYYYLYSANPTRPRSGSSANSCVDRRTPDDSIASRGKKKYAFWFLTGFMALSFLLTLLIVLEGQTRKGIKGMRDGRGRGNGTGREGKGKGGRRATVTCIKLISLWTD